MEVDREIGTLWYRAAEVLMGATTYTPKVSSSSLLLLYSRYRS